MITRTLIHLISFYQKRISPLYQSHCIYTPSCSTYAICALKKYGTLRGGWLAVKRICRCHPFHHGGFDPVP